ncbi:MAG: DUF2971 domain-containing protein [Undibacterium sp.]|nr:DUF2971 domain-containing protein [Opitutaceae bacterium]
MPNPIHTLLPDGTQDIQRLLAIENNTELLYKFRSCQNPLHQKSLADGKIWIGEATALNDPFDSKPKEFLSRSTAEEANSYRDAVRSLRVLCFCGPLKGDGDDILRWSHYGDGHQGYCLMINDANLVAKTRSVSYEPHYPNLAELTPTSPNFWDKVGFFKAPAWRYEDERRALFPNSTATEYTIPPGAIWGVAFGCWSLHVNRIEVARHAHANNPKCYYFDAEIVTASYSLNYRNATVVYRQLMQ